MQREQNYIDQHILDPISIRILYGTMNLEFMDIFNRLRRHELPHLILLNVTPEDLIPKFSGYHSQTNQLKQPWVRIWKHESLFMGQCLHIGDFDSPDSPDAIVIRTSQIRRPNDDLRIDPKNRYRPMDHQTLPAPTKWVIASGPKVYYTEHRRLGMNCVLTRVLTHTAKGTILRHKLPVYYTPANSARGQFLHNLTKTVQSYDTQKIVTHLELLKNMIYRSKGRLSETQLIACVPEDQTLELLRLGKLIYEIEPGRYIMTRRGNFLIYSSSFSSSSSSFSPSDMDCAGSTSPLGSKTSSG